MTAAVPANSKQSRIGSLDVLRGATVLAMILVNNPGSWEVGAIWSPLRHAAWHGCTPTDLIFPFFLFIVGASMALVEERSAGGGSAWQVLWQAMRRSLVLIGLGLFLNFFGQWSFSGLRIPGVLQRIGVCYILAAVLLSVLGRVIARLSGVSGTTSVSVVGPGQEGLRAATLRRWQLGVVVVGVPIMLLAHTGLLAGLPLAFGEAGSGGAVPTRWPESIGASANAQQVIDDAVFGRRHLYQPKQAVGVTDPEGLLSTITATGTVLLGFGLMTWWRVRTREATELATREQLPHSFLTRPTRVLALAGVALAMLGYAMAGFPSLGEWFGDSPAWALPLNKPLWTGSYVLWTGGLAAMALAGLLGFEARGDRHARNTGTLAHLGGLIWLACAAAGRNAILVFLGSGLLARLLVMLPGPGGGGGAGGQTAKGWIVGVLQSATDSLLAASTLFAVGHVVLWIGIAVLLDRRRWYLKV